MLKELSLKNFRSYAELNIQFGSAWTVFCGANGAGKSNLLEAVFFLTMLRSFRTTVSRELVRHGESSTEVRGLLERGIWKEELTVNMSSDGARGLRRNGRAVGKSSDFIDLALPVAFAPEDVMLISGNASGRRRFADMYLSLLDPVYRRRLYNYNSALMQRNNALKRGRAASAMAQAFEPVMAENALYVMQRRKLFANLVAAETAELLKDDPDAEFAVQYRPNAWVDSAAELRDQLCMDRDKEIKRGCTLSGPQLDDFLFTLRGAAMRSFASSGQRRKIAVCLKMAAYSLLRRKSGGKQPLVVLVDDVTGELDAANRERFLEQVKTADQAFFTFTSMPTDAAFAVSEKFAVNNSNVIRLRS